VAFVERLADDHPREVDLAQVGERLEVEHLRARFGQGLQQPALARPGLAAHDAVGEAQRQLQQVGGHRAAVEAFRERRDPVFTRS